MRLLGLIVCCLLLAGCTETASSTPKPKPVELTAVSALGDFRTLDFCSLLDASGGEPVSSFELCLLEADGITWQVGPITDVEQPANGKDFPGKPAGVVVREAGSNPPECARWVTFADRISLWVSASGGVSSGAQCEAADKLVGGVFTAIEHKRVRHVTYGPDSYGSITPCSLVTGPEFAVLLGGGNPTTEVTGHTCAYGNIGLVFGIGKPTAGTRETIGGRAAVLVADGVSCQVVFERPLANRPGFVETAMVYSKGGRVCETVRPVAELVAPKLPQ